MRLQDLPLEYQKQVVAKLTGGAAIKGTHKGCPEPRADMAISTPAESEGKRNKAENHVLPVGDEFPKLIDSDIGLFCDDYGKTYATWMKMLVRVNPSHVPTAQQKGIDSRRGDKVRVFTKPHIKSWKDAFTAVFLNYWRLYKERQFAYTELGVQVSLSFKFPFPSGATKRDMVENAPMVKRPDGDNLAKMVIDALVAAHLLPDDNCITRTVIEKSYTLSDPYMLVTIERDKFRNVPEHLRLKEQKL